MSRQERLHRAHGINPQHFQNAGLAGFQVYRTVNVHALAPARLVERNLGSLGSPTAHGPRSMGRMHRIGKHHRLIAGQTVQQSIIGLNKGLLPGLVELDRYCLRLAVFHP